MRRDRNWRFPILALMVALAAVVLGACGSDDDDDTGADGKEPLKIGFAGALSGQGAFADVPMRSGIELAVDEINEDGGVDGHPIELNVKDMQSDPKLGSVVAQELIDDGSAVLVGPPFPDQLTPVVQAGAEAGLITLEPVLTDPEPILRIAPESVLLVTFSDAQQAAADAETALAQGAKTAVTVSSPDISHTINTPKYFSEVFTNGGGEILGDVQYTLGQKEYDTVAQRVADMNPDVIYAGMIVPDAPVFLKALRAAGVDAPVFGSDGLDSPDLIDVAGDAAENTFYTTHAFDEPGSETARVMDEIEEREGQRPESTAFAALGYDAIYVIKAAAEDAESVDREALTEALGQPRTVEGITGTTNFDGVGVFPEKPVTVVQVKDGRLELVDQVVPKEVPEFIGF